MICSGQLSIDPERYLVTVSGRAVQLTYLEFNALWTIARLEGRIATYDALTTALWNEHSPQTRRRLTVLISRMRSKLGEDAGARVDTVMRVGYRLTEPPDAAQPAPLDQRNGASAAQPAPLDQRNGTSAAQPAPLDQRNGTSAAEPAP